MLQLWLPGMWRQRMRLDRVLGTLGSARLGGGSTLPPELPMLPCWSQGQGRAHWGSREMWGPGVPAAVGRGWGRGWGCWGGRCGVSESSCPARRGPGSLRAAEPLAPDQEKVNN